MHIRVMPSYGKKFFLTLVILLSVSIKTHAEQETEGWHKTSLNSISPYCIETLPTGIMVGEFNTNVLMNPYNGIYFSSDLGDTWTLLGLAHRGITDITYFNNKIYGGNCS